ncbi:MAG TPA: PIN domain-containing protein [Candidatus Paceibacterota bacterium]
MANELLADSDFFIALYKRDDTNHEMAVRLLETIGEKNMSIILSVFAYSEITTVLQRIGKATARNFMEDVETSGVRIVLATETLFEKAKHIFRQQRSKNVSFTDAANIALANMQGFDTIVSFDNDYKKNGLRLFPDVLQEKESNHATEE